MAAIYNNQILVVSLIKDLKAKVENLEEIVRKFENMQTEDASIGGSNTEEFNFENAYRHRTRLIQGPERNSDDQKRRDDDVRALSMAEFKTTCAERGLTAAVLKENAKLKITSFIRFLLQKMFDEGELLGKSRSGHKSSKHAPGQVVKERADPIRLNMIEGKVIRFYRIFSAQFFLYRNFLFF